MSEKIKKQKERLPADVVLHIQKTFPNFNPGELKDTDLEMWEAIQNKTAAKEQYERYRSGLIKDFGLNASTPESPRLQFCDFLGDRIQGALYDMEFFRKEISGIVSAEVARSLETAHFLKLGGSLEPDPDFHVEDLTEEDMQIWRKVQEGTITRRDMEAYREKVNEIKQKEPAVWRSRNIFCAFIANKASPVISGRERKK